MGAESDNATACGAPGALAACPVGVGPGLDVFQWSLVGVVVDNSGCSNEISYKFLKIFPVIALGIGH